jgi:plasmid stabilization system protein ParE
MAYRLAFLSLALEDKRNIQTYLKQFYPNTPRKFVAALREKLHGLKENPYMYQTYEGNPAYRKMVVSNYLVFYKVNEGRRIVEIHRILPGSWDTARIVGSRQPI